MHKRLSAQPKTPEYTTDFFKEVKPKVQNSDQVFVYVLRMTRVLFTQDCNEAFLNLMENR